MSSGPPDLSPVLGATTVAIVGASDRNYYTRSVFENLRAFGFPPEGIRLVNPNRPEAFGVPCAPHLDAPVDLAVVATPRTTVPGVLRDLAAAGARACVVLSDGFAEAGPDGARLQREAAEAAGDMLLVGPNTMGLVVPGARLGAWGAVLPPLRDGGVSLLFQSSGLLNLFMGLVSDRRIGIRAAISVGNEAGLTYVDHLRALLEDERTRAIVSFLESVADGRALRGALERADDLGKPIVVLRVGRSERARRNVVAHTGRLAAAGAAWDALFRQTGVITVANVDELLETAALFSRTAGALPGGDGVGLLTISGGDCTLLSDLAARAGVRLPEPAAREDLAELVGKPTLLGNPLDIEDLLRTDPERSFRALELLAADRQVAVVGIRLNLPERPTEALRESYQRAAKIVRARGKLVVVLTRASEALDPTWYQLFDELDVPLVREYEKALRAIAALIGFAQRSKRRRGAPAPRRSRPQGYVLPAKAGRLSFSEAMELLRAHGIPFVASDVAGSADAAVAAAARLGYPVALKADIAHKSDSGAVRLDLGHAAAVRAAFADVAAVAPGAAILVQRMERGVAECLVGVTRDDHLGPVLAVGLGGVLVEVLHDVSLRLPPITEEDVREMVAELRGGPLLRGARGREPADVEALVDLVVRVGELARDLGERISQLDLNPVVLRPASRGAAAVDVLIETSAPPS